jgi:hypothetical protein
MFHKIDPYVVRKIDYKNDIVFMTPLDTKGAGPQTSE